MDSVRADADCPSKVKVGGINNNGNIPKQTNAAELSQTQISATQIEQIRLPDMLEPKKRYDLGI